jgi:hypothetical protein
MNIWLFKTGKNSGRLQAGAGRMFRSENGIDTLTVYPALKKDFLLRKITVIKSLTNFSEESKKLFKFFP